MPPSRSKINDHTADRLDDMPAVDFTEAVRRAILARAYLRREMTAAVAGAGTSSLAASVAASVRKVHVVEQSQVTLDAAREAYSSTPNLECHLADSVALPLPDKSVDVVFATLQLRDSPDLLASVRESVRVLKPGGRLLAICPDRQGFKPDALSAKLQQAGLVNIIVTGAGETDQPGVIIATGSMRLAMRETVQQAYTAAALTGCGCGCSTPSEESSSCCDSMVSEQSSCCGSSVPQQSSCCGEQVSVPVQDALYERSYSPEERSDIPTEAAEISLGCGNPVALAGLRPGEVVLDIGSGGGIDAFLAARRVAPTGKVIGVDMTPAMLQRARRAAKHAGITNVTFRHGQAEKLPVEDGTVDVILSNCVINLCEDKGLVFTEAFRALKPGGRLEVSDIVTDGAFSARARQDSGEWAGCISGALPASEYLELISQAGFVDVTTRKSTLMGEMDGVLVSSAIVSARKPGG